MYKYVDMCDAQNSLITYMKKDIAACSFSGGKDSVLALYYAKKLGYDVKYLVNFISRKYKRSSFHGIPADILQIQAECLGIPLLQYTVGKTSNSYEKTFIKMLNRLKKLKVKYFICGDIYLEEHPRWIKKQCDRVGLKLVEPLWKKNVNKVLKEFIELNFKAKIVSVNANILPKKFVGKEIDRKFIENIKKFDICPCGENGEYHTFVYDGPIFNKKIKILNTKVVLKKTFWSAWFLEIKDIVVEEKN